MARYEDENGSGLKEKSIVPDSVAKKFNWGAFCIGLFWGLGNQTFIVSIISAILYTIKPLLKVLPFGSIVGLIAALGFSIWFGLKGNTWAWQNKKWKSEKEFHDVQKNWAIVGIILEIAALLTFASLVKTRIHMTQTTRAFDLLSALGDAQMTFKNLEFKEVQGCSDTPQDLAYCVERDLNNRSNLYEASVIGNKIYVTTLPNSSYSKEAIWTFLHDDENNEYKAIIDINGEKKPNKEQEDVATLTIEKNEAGYFNFKEDEFERYKKALDKIINKRL